MLNSLQVTQLGLAVAMLGGIGADGAHATGEGGGFSRYHLHLPRLRPTYPSISLPETLRVEVRLGDQEPPAHRPLERLTDVGPALAQCLQNPSPTPLSEQGEHREVTFLFSFRRDGSLIAPPRLTYSVPSAQSDSQRPFADAARAAIVGCAPLSFTARFASAIAGRPFAVRIIDQGKPIERLKHEQRTRQSTDP
jgi:hypothetical protein